MGDRKELCFILQQVTGRKSVTKIAAVVACFTSVKNTCKRLRYSQTFGGLLQCNVGKMEESEGCNRFCHRILHVRSEIDQGWISRKVLKHGISLVPRYVLCTYLSLFYL